MPCQQCGRESHDDPVSWLVGNKTTAELYKLQLDDTVVGIILKTKEMGKRPLDKSVKQS